MRPISAIRFQPSATRILRAAAVSMLVLALAACQNQGAAPSEGRPVRVVKVEAGKLANDIKLSGEIQAEKNVGLGFRIGGRVAERPVNVGDRVAAGQIVARLDPSLERNALTAAKAALEAARGEVNTARNTFERQERLMAQGFTTRPRFDQSLKAQEAAQAQLENAEAQVELAQDRLGFTELRAGVSGVVTARSIEPGEVVQAGQVVLQLAREDGRDAVFNVPARLLETLHGDIPIRVTLAEAPTVSAFGRIREVAPQADPVTRTFAVRIGLIDPPEEMRLGSTVVGTMELTSASIVAVPASAVTQQGLSPAVWIVDPVKSTVSLRNIDILRFDPGLVIVSQGLEPGEVIVSGGIQTLHPGQRVQPLPATGEAGRTAAAAPPPGSPVLPPS
ncbi:efflux RND transporter periplasmic adaptor subunit [Bosea sp. BIWAKO-01]|uniref:efflux RND transporter periplasmic adaptor subunit n=1 Tax=Bosea sp. BIWAKO-01 TaxID=506668 RepID=UPI000869FD5D|nr:efflux RND transporter periplasmic adaptor subunit [Bosea sp. BIWAKO-01]GAU81770.1 Co/Zn/Cd efflux system membrane fusion protein [Bosea sp. BIWAKO-01]